MFPALSLIAIFAIGIAVVIWVGNRSYWHFLNKGNKRDQAELKSGLLGYVAMFATILLLVFFLMKLLAG